MAKQPMNPLAGAAGPGPFSTRTDNLTFKSDFYGAGVENAANLEGGPLAKTPDVRATSLSEMGMAPSQREPIIPLYAPSQRKDEPITTGIVPGDGAGPEALGMNQPSVDTDADRQRMLSYLPALETIAQSPSSSQSFRNYVRLLKANLL